jgi:hypothetical protein
MVGVLAASCRTIWQENALDLCIMGVKGHTKAWSTALVVHMLNNIPLRSCLPGYDNRYVKFDTFHPAVDRGLPVTRVISRITLQEVLAAAVER